MLFTLVPHLGPPLLREALRSTEQRGWAASRVSTVDHAKLLLEIGIRLPEVERPAILSVVLELLQGLWNSPEAGDLLSQLAPHLDDALLRVAIKIARLMLQKGKHYEALAHLAVYLPESERWEALRDVLFASRAIYNPKKRASLFAVLAPHLTEPLLKEALQLAEEQEGDWMCALLLGALAPYVTPSLRTEAIRIAENIETAANRALALAELARYEAESTDPTIQIEMEAAPDSQEVTAFWHDPRLQVRTIQHAHGRIRAELELVPGLSLDSLPDVLLETLGSVRRIGDQQDRAGVLVGLLPHLQKAWPQQVLAVARTISDRIARIHVLVDLVPHLDGKERAEVLSEIFTEFRELDDYYCARQIARLAPHLPVPLREQAVRWARAFDEPADRARALAGLAPHLPEGVRRATLAEAIRNIEEIDSEQEFFAVEVMGELWPHLPESMFDAALRVACALGDLCFRARALAGLAPRLPQHLLKRTLAAAGHIETEADRAEALAGLAPYLTGDLARGAIQMAGRMFQPAHRVRLLASLAPHLPSLLLNNTLHAVSEIADGNTRVKLVAALAPYLPETVRNEALDAAREEVRHFPWPRWQAHALLRLSPHWPQEHRLLVLAEALRTALQVRDPADRAEVLAQAAAQLAEFSSHQIRKPCAETLRTLNMQSRAALLRDLCSLLPLIRGMGSAGACALIAQAVLDVGIWFP